MSSNTDLLIYSKHLPVAVDLRGVPASGSCLIIWRGHRLKPEIFGRGKYNGTRAGANYEVSQNAAAGANCLLRLGSAGVQRDLVRTNARRM